MLSTGLILAAVCVILSIYGASGQTSNLVLIYIIVNHYNYCSDLLSDCSTTNALQLYNSNGNITTEGGMLQICRSGTWTAVCDFGFSCSYEGKAACRQLGYSGSQISECMSVYLYTLKVVVHTVLILLLAGKISH